MQVVLSVGEDWVNLNGAVGKNAQGEDVTIELTGKMDIKIYPTTLVLGAYQWYQGTKIPLAQTSLAAMPIPQNEQSYATYDGTEDFFVRATAPGGRLTVIVTTGE